MSPQAFKSTYNAQTSLWSSPAPEVPDADIAATRIRGRRAFLFLIRAAVLRVLVERSIRL
jgi:hypothetical protein